MAQLLATYTLNGERHRIELVSLRGGALVLDRPGEGPVHVVASELGLCRALADDEVLGRPSHRRAA